MEGNSVKAPSSDVVAGRGANTGQRALRRGSVPAVAIMAAVLGLAACGLGSGGSSHAGASTGSPSTNSQLLAYSRCVRSHGVPNFPDPDSSGNLPANAKDLMRSSPQFPAASTACQQLLPDGGQPTQAERQQQLQQDWSQYRQFAQCMRDHGVPNFPDPTADPPHPERPNFNLSAAGFASTPQIVAKAQECQSQLHLSQLPNHS
jgi:hypothetical protein